MTAVEFLISELKKYGDTCPKYEINYVIEIPTHILTELEGQAKEMEKEQIINARQSGIDATINGKSISNIDYYNETFKSE
jgi:hypothetical protein